MNKGFLTSDWFAGLLFSLIFALCAFAIFSDSFDSLERYAYDIGVQAGDRVSSDRVAVISIDDQSIENIGRWPWPRDLHAQMIQILNEGGAKVIGNTILYSEPQVDPGLLFINDIQETWAQSSLAGDAAVEAQTIAAILAELKPSLEDEMASGKPGPNTELFLTLAQVYEASSLSQRLPTDLESIIGKLDEASIALNTDETLAATFAASGNIVLPMAFILGTPQGRPDQPLPEYVSRNSLANTADNVGAVVSGNLPIPTLASLAPIPLLGESAAGIGHISVTPDVDGAQRTEPLALEHFGEYYPSLSLVLAAKALNLKNEDIQLRLGEGVTLQNLKIDTTPDLRMYTYFYGDRAADIPAFSVDSFFDVMVGNIPPNKYKDKIVLIGATATGIGDSFPTPISGAMPPVLTLAHTVSSILQEDFFTRPSWAGYAELGLFVLIALYIILLLPRLKASIAMVITTLLVVGLLVTHMIAMTGADMWLQLMVPVTFLLTGHLFMTLKLFRVTEKLKLTSEAEGAESNKMLGLAFQGQGQLDMAFDKFRKCPVDEPLLDLLYNLALDYERKRQFNKAHSVYEYMSKHKADFRDLPQKMTRAKKMEETVIIGGATQAGTLIMDGDDMEKPMLGRYEVEKELGKGAMGVVYLGKDPKINRTVAIKTMALSQEFEEDELEEVKERFFREAETAGRLNHPNIVSIFDAGEEHDLAYIAMEFIKGYDLTKHIKPDTLLPVEEVLKVVADSADALGYAHNQNVVHRDIKPANLMYLPDDKIVKVTDFGIARLTDSSKTKTGMVLGTPSYMSPEQLSGKKVDGRSDLFSLGVTLYQMLTGELPFQGDSMATLMYKIANEEQAAVTTVRPDLPESLNEIISHAMSKDADTRFATGAEFAAALRAHS